MGAAVGLPDLQDTVFARGGDATLGRPGDGEGGGDPDPMDTSPDPETDTGPEPETDAAPEPEPARSDDDPFDYEASEQISEDLSVSFPVDI